MTINGYVLKRTTDGKYVAPPGMEHSYTRRLEDAHIFATAEQAWANACQDNEEVIPLDNILWVNGGKLSPHPRR